MTKEEKEKLLAELQEAVDRFHRGTRSVGDALSDALDLLDDDAVPSKTLLDDLNEGISGLSEIRSFCENLIVKLGSDGLPGTFTELAEEIRQIEKLFDKSEYIEAKDFLLRLNIHDEKIRVLFDELKKDLLSIDIDSLDIDECRASMGKYVDFRNMLLAPAEEKAGYMVRIANDFDQRVLSLAFTGAYTVEDEVCEIMPVETHTDDGKGTEQETIQEIPIVSDEDDDLDELDEDMDFSEVSYGMKIKDLVAETGYKYASLDNIDVHVEESVNQSSKPFSVKKFKESLRDKPFAINVLKTMYTMGMFRMLRSDIKKNNFGNVPKMYEETTDKEFSECVDFLIRNGYLKKLSADGYPSIVGLTQKGAEIYSNKSACEFIGFPYSKDDGEIKPLVTSTQAYIAGVLRLLTYDAMGDEAGLIDTYTPYYHVMYGSVEDVVYTAAVPVSDYDLDMYLDTFAEKTEGRILNEVHVFQQTKAQANALIEILSKLGNGSITEGTLFYPHYNELPLPHNVFADNGKKKALSKNKPKIKIKEKNKDSSEESKSAEKASDPKEKKEKEKKSEKAGKESVKKAVSPEKATSIDTKKEKAASDRKHVQKKGEKAFAASVNEKTEQFIANSDKLYCATAYARAAALENVEAAGLADMLSYAVNDPAVHCTYTSEKLFSIFTDFPYASSYYYQVAAVLRLIFAGQARYDYNLQAIHDSINGSPALKDNKDLNDLIYTLREFKTKTGYAVDRYADYRSHDRVELENDLIRLKAEASAFYENDFIKQRMMKTKTINRRYEATWRTIFAKDGDFATYVKAVAENDTDFVELAKEFVEEVFIKEGMPVCANNIDPRKIDELMDREWSDVDIADKVALVMKSTNLMGAMRNNFRQHINKSAAVIASWVEIHEALGDGTDSGYETYASIKSKLTALADKAADAAAMKIKDADLSTKAGLLVLVNAIKEIRAKIDGSYNVDEQRYFYSDFLRHNYVMLGEDYLPDFDCTVPLVDEMRMMRLIEKHVAEEGGSLTENVSDYCGDNFGSARLIIDLISSETGKTPDIAETLPEAEKYAEGQIELTHKDFVSDLELAQSYGQLDADDAEDKKDNILRLADKWYEWAEETHNFGFYKQILGEMRLQIKADAAGRGEVMTKELESILTDNKTLERDYGEYIEKIRKTIEKQNYLVAEDMINHLLAGDIPQEAELFEEDYLADFQKSYSFYYKLAGTSGQSLSSLVKTNDIKALSDKDQTGALALKNSWPNPKKKISPESLRTMLSALGFDVDKVSLSDPSNSIFTVKIKRSKHENENSYGHPVYGFGSRAASDGFRVVWLSGAYNADGLISKFNELGKSKHTIALLDHNLSENERRRLARKIKEDGSSKIFGVIDRVLYMFLIHNYSNTYISRMLMECMMPFAFFQPYVFNSATVMPPEMFMGRKDELEKIKDPAGVNLVYGGRQLGKSALLRKAKADINGADDNELAVLIDIKDLDYVETARKVSQTLLEEKVISEPVEDETDWNEIARAVKSTLKESKRIRYLLLMLDEADKFLESCEEVGYSPFNALKDIQQSVEAGRFKFVVAGLRNVVRFNKAATSGNSVLPHLEPLIIKPFTTQEARMLLEQPLYFLGFRFPEDNTDLVPMILATANYFPGLIQLYCARLIEALKKNYGDYNERTSPPYEIKEGLIKRVLAESDFRSQIREKFMITLKVGDDDYYYILALILAYLYMSNDREDGYTSTEILEIAEEFCIKRIGDMSADQIDALMTELCELNVMRVTSGGKYLFSRYNFLSMMGTSDEVDERLLSFTE